MTSVNDVFQDYAQAIESEHAVKEKIRDQMRAIEVLGRETSAVLQKIHQPQGLAQLPTIVAKAEEYLRQKVQPALSEFVALLPEREFHRFYAMFNYTLMRMSHLCSLIYFLKTDELLSREAMATEWLHIGVKTEDGFYLEVEDYLGGLIQTSNELARFSVNCVTHGDFVRPVKICKFLSDLLAGFRLLNLKNDNLRKKFDSLKYDMKKVEEVVYDLSIRGLLKTTTPDAQGDD